MYHTHTTRARYQLKVVEGLFTAVCVSICFHLASVFRCLGHRSLSIAISTDVSCYNPEIRFEEAIHDGIYQ